MINADLVLTNTGELKGKLQIDRSGYDALNTRKTYFSKGEKDYVTHFFGTKSWELGKSEFQNQNETQKPFKEAHEVVINEHVAITGDIIYMNPFILAQVNENPFKSEKREYPVDFACAFDKLYSTKITIPEGYAVEELPKGKVIVLPNNGGKYSYNVSQMGSTLVITSNFSINQTLFVQNEYPFLREFYNQVIAKQAEQIVLKKN